MAVTHRFFFGDTETSMPMGNTSIAQFLQFWKLFFGFQSKKGNYTKKGRQYSGDQNAKKFRTFDGVIGVPAPVILCHVPESRVDASLSGHSVGSSGKHLFAI